MALAPSSPAGKATISLLKMRLWQEFCSPLLFLWIWRYQMCSSTVHFLTWRSNYLSSIVASVEDCLFHLQCMWHWFVEDYYHQTSHLLHFFIQLTQSQKLFPVYRKFHQKLLCFFFSEFLCLGIIFQTFLHFKKHFSVKIKFRYVILFADYIKFGPQTFDCYIYFVLNIYFLISSLKI